jgi:hypothetical protein
MFQELDQGSGAPLVCMLINNQDGSQNHFGSGMYKKENVHGFLQACCWNFK